MDEKRLRKKVALIMTDYEEGRLQPTPAGHAQLANPSVNYFLLVWLMYFETIFSQDTFLEKTENVPSQKQVKWWPHEFHRKEATR
jgi:hypothetical protein